MDAFDEDTYKIVGIYTQKIRQDGARDALGFNEVIVPERSVEGDWSDHIVSAAPMSASNTTFQIPNGSIRSYMEKFRTLGLDQLEIRFYDDGYTDLEEGIENRRITSGVLLAGGSLMTVLVPGPLWAPLYLPAGEAHGDREEPWPYKEGLRRLAFVRNAAPYCRRRAGRRLRGSPSYGGGRWTDRGGQLP